MKKDTALPGFLSMLALAAAVLLVAFCSGCVCRLDPAAAAEILTNLSR